MPTPASDHEERHGPASYGVLAWLCLAAIIAYICRNSISAAESTIEKDLGLSEKEMGLVMAAFFMTYAGLSIPAGWFAHFWGSRRSLPFFTVCWSAATAVMAFAGGLGTLFGTRLVSGAAQSGLFPGSVNTLSRWFPPARRGLASAALGACMSIGGAIGVSLMGVLIEPVGWRVAFLLFSIPGILWALGFFVCFRERSQPYRSGGAGDLARATAVAENDVEAAEEAAPPTPWGALVESPATWWISGQQFFRAAGYIFFATWFATYLQKTRGVSEAEAGFLNSLPLLAVIPGSFLGGLVSDWVLARTGSRRLARQGVAAASLLACALMVLLAHDTENLYVAVLIISTGSLCAAMAGPCAYAITMDMGGWHVAVLFSTMNMAGNMGAVVFPLFVPWFRQWTGSWESVLLLFGAMYLGATLCWLLVNPAGTIFDHASPDTEAAADGPRRESRGESGP